MKRNNIGEPITINVVTLNRTGEIFGLLQSINSQTYTNWDLMIVDDSKDPIISQKYISDLLNRMRFDGHKVTYVHNPVRLGVAKARNQAVELSESELILRLDDDSFIEPDFIEKLVKPFNDPQVGAVGGLVPQAGMPEQFKHTDELPNGIFNKIIITETDIQLADDGGYVWEGLELIKSHHLRSSFIFRKSAWQKVKGFSTEYGYVGFREETDFCLKLIMNGYILLTIPSAINWHGHALSGGCRDEAYGQKVQMCDAIFKRKFLRYLRNGKLKKEMVE